MILFQMLVASAFAEPVFVAPFLAVDSMAEETAENLADVILETLEQNPKVEGSPVEVMNPVHDVSAAEYVALCLPDEFVGCAFVVGKASQMTYSVTGRVSSLERGYEVDLRVIEIATAREVFQLDLQIAPEGEEIFAQTVSETLTGIVTGSIGQEVDLRSEEDEDIGLDEVEVAAVDQFTKEEGGAETVEERVDVEFDQKKLTEQDLEYMMMMEGSKEWDRLGMKPKEYLKYYNSGMSLARWKALNRGRKGQVLVRADLGVARGLYSGQYYGRIAKSNIDLSPIDLYAWQTLDNGNGIDVTGSVSYGLLPELDVGVLGGLTTGSFNLDVHSFVIGQFSAVPPSQTYATTTSYIGVQGLYTPLVMPRVRPVTGGQVVHYRSGNMRFDFGGEAYPDFPGANFTTLELLMGCEIRMNEFLDVYAHVPIGVAFLHNNAPSVQQQSGGILSVDLDSNDVAQVSPPDRFSRLGGSLNIGVQFRIPIVKEKVNALEMYE